MIGHGRLTTSVVGNLNVPIETRVTDVLGHLDRYDAKLAQQARVRALAREHLQHTTRSERYIAHVHASHA